MRTLAVGAGVLLALAPVACSGSDETPVVVRLQMHHSKFVPDRVDVPRGRPVRFEIVNSDPIDHEWIVGDQAVHDRHEKGTEASHSAVPTEKSVDALASVTTTVVFRDAGTLEFACHLPGHYDFGMKGTVTIR